MFTAYYILAISFGVVMALISIYAIKFRPDDSFPGKLYGPLIILAVFFSVATLAAVIHGGNEEVEHRKHEAAEKGESYKNKPTYDIRQPDDLTTAEQAAELQKAAAEGAGDDPKDEN